MSGLFGKVVLGQAIPAGIRDVDGMNRARDAWLAPVWLDPVWLDPVWLGPVWLGPAGKPARATVEAKLADPRRMVEIAAIAALP
jgi:enamine deaminase RidA (YjgF/YER057c/UK114 family)